MVTPKFIFFSAHQPSTQPNNKINYQTNSGFDFDQQIISSASNISDKENDSNNNNNNIILSSTPRNFEPEPTKNNKTSKLPSLEERLDDYYDSINQFEKDPEKTEKLDKMKSIDRLRKRVERKEKRTVKDLSKFFERTIL